MDGDIFGANGDLTQLTAHAIAYSTSTALQGQGNLYPAFASHVPGFAQRYTALTRIIHTPQTCFPSLPESTELVVWASSRRGMNNPG
jgi:hypothetical protein